nr:hypothetical protein HK105_006006 [Polyrhizophydium stewartii]
MALEVHPPALDISEHPALDAPQHEHAAHGAGADEQHTATGAESPARAALPAGSPHAEAASDAHAESDQPEASYDPEEPGFEFVEEGLLEGVAAPAPAGESDPAAPAEAPQAEDAYETPEPPNPFFFHPTHSVRFSAEPGASSRAPPNSRLFIGNLPSEKTTKREIASIFVKYGSILEISLKSSFGFVQYDNPTSCQMAIQCENHRTIGDLKLDLKVSKDRPEADRRGGNSGPDRNYDARRHERPKPYDRHCQIVVIGDVERGFVSRVSTVLRKSRISCETTYFAPHMNLKALVSQLQADGFKAVVFVERSRERSGRVAMQVFSLNGRVEEFDNITLERASDLIHRSSIPGYLPQQTPQQAPQQQLPQQASPPMPTQTQAQYGQNTMLFGAGAPPPQQMPAASAQAGAPPPGSVANISNVLNQLSASSRLLQAIQGLKQG